MNKLIINYDFFKEIRNVNEPLSPFKIIRNEKYKWTLVPIPLLIASTHIINNNLSNMFFLLGVSFEVLTFNRFILGTLYGDEYRKKAAYTLRELLTKLLDLNISTDYNLLLKSMPSKRNYKIKINPYKLPQILKIRYILVPCYSDYNDYNSVNGILIKEDHILGSNIYTLSIESPKSKLKKLSFDFSTEK